MAKQLDKSEADGETMANRDEPEAASSALTSPVAAIDLVASIGGQEAMVEELRMKILPGKHMKMLQAKPEGRAGVVEW